MKNLLTKPTFNIEYLVVGVAAWWRVLDNLGPGSGLGVDLLDSLPSLADDQPGPVGRDEVLLCDLVAHPTLHVWRLPVAEVSCVKLDFKKKL